MIIKSISQKSNFKRRRNKTIHKNICPISIYGNIRRHTNLNNKQYRTFKSFSSVRRFASLNEVVLIQNPDYALLLKDR